MVCCAEGVVKIDNSAPRAEDWLALPGFWISLETSVRYMCKSEQVSSTLRNLALGLIMHDSHAMLHTFSKCLSLHQDQSSMETLASTSLFVSLFKSVRLAFRPQLQIDPRETVSGHSFPVLAQLLFGEISQCTLLANSAWKGRDVATLTAQSASQKADCNTQHNNDEFRGGLQLLLVLLRSWVLMFWEICDESTCNDAHNTLVVELGEMVMTFHEFCKMEDDGQVIMDVMEVCGLQGVMDKVADHMVGEERKDAKAPNKGHACWERFAFQHLVGRVLPGCSNWGCKNMDGFSEAALQTKVCSGCRRARYCSKECQQQAWGEEEHKEVCGKLQGHIHCQL